jgi:hypothetical protein
MRQFLEVAVPLVLPTALYLLYTIVATRRAPALPGQLLWWREVPWLWLAAAGAVLVAVCLVAFALFGGAAPGSAYRPARLIDGKVVPGQLGN